MNTIEQTTEPVDLLSVENIAAVQRDPGVIAQELGGTILGPDRSLVDPSLEDWKELRKLDEMGILKWLLEQPEEVIEESFNTVEPLETDKLSPEAKLLHDFSCDLVQKVTGMSREDASKAAGSQPSLVSAVVHGFVESEKYGPRLRRTVSIDPERAESDVKCFATMSPEFHSMPEMIVRIGHVMRGEGDSRHKEETISVDSLLRGETGSSFMVTQEGNGEPQVFEKRYMQRAYHTERVEDPEAERQYVLAILGDMSSAWDNHRSIDDSNALGAARSNLSLI